VALRQRLALLAARIPQGEAMKVHRSSGNEQRHEGMQLARTLAFSIAAPF
jgi:hypothetical protein